MSLPASHWTIDGTPVFLGPDWSAQSLAMRGFDQMRGTMTELSWRKLTASGQGSVVRGYSDGGDVIWEGRLSSAPQIVAGEAKFAAQGYYVEAERKDDRLFLQSRDMGLWAPLDGEPFVNSSGVPVYDVNKRIDVQVGNRLQYSLTKDEEATNGDKDGAGAWVEGVLLSQVEFTMNYSAPDETTDTQIRVQRSTGPVSAEQNVDAFVTSGANRNATKTVSIGSPEDMVHICFEIAATHTPTTRKKYAVTKVILWGDITTAATYNAYQVVNHIASTLGWDTSNIVTSTFNVLPFDWADGDWAAAASYIAELEDKQWGVYESDSGGDPMVTYDSWGGSSDTSPSNDWTVYLSNGADVDLLPLEVFNKATVWYTDPRGRLRQSTVTASPDPLSGTGIVNTYEFSLGDKQGDATLAASVGNKLLSRFGRQRYSGKATVIRAFDWTGRDNPYGIRPGDTVTIADWGPGETQQLRVYDVTLRENRVELGLEQPVNLTWLLRNYASPRGGGGGGRGGGAGGAGFGGIGGGHTGGRGIPASAGGG
jgi:uncharacterized membrane protein YgcG